MVELEETILEADIVKDSDGVKVAVERNGKVLIADAVRIDVPCIVVDGERTTLNDGVLVMDGENEIVFDGEGIIEAVTLNVIWGNAVLVEDFDGLSVAA